LYTYFFKYCKWLISDVATVIYHDIPSNEKVIMTYRPMKKFQIVRR